MNQRNAADLVLSGDPSTSVGDVRKVDTVFRQGIGYDPVKLIESVAAGWCCGRPGLRGKPVMRRTHGGRHRAG